MQSPIPRWNLRFGIRTRTARMWPSSRSTSAAIRRGNSSRWRWRAWIIKTKEAEKKEQEKPKLSKAEPLDGDKNITTGALPPIDETDFPKARQARADAVAVIIGNRNYRNAPPVDYAVRDAEAMKVMVM